MQGGGCSEGARREEYSPEKGAEGVDTSDAHENKRSDEQRGDGPMLNLIHAASASFVFAPDFTTKLPPRRVSAALI